MSAVEMTAAAAAVVTFQRPIFCPVFEVAPVAVALVAPEAQ